MKALIFTCFALIFINLSSAVKLSPLKFDQEVCFVHSYPKGMAQEATHSYCPEGYTQEWDDCVEKCRPGYVTDDRNFYRCYTPCPEEFKFVYGSLCQRWSMI